MIINPFLLFGGNASEAIDFYCEALDLKCVFKNTYGNTPLEVSEKERNWIVHSELSHNNKPFLMLADVEKKKIGDNVHLSINYDNLEYMKRSFNKLSQGGKVTMPIAKQFWNAYFGTLIDRYGFHWTFNYQLKDDEQ